MKKVLLPVLVGLAFNAYSRDAQLLYVEKGVTSPNIVEKVIIDDGDGGKSLDEIRQEMLATGKYKFVEFDSIEWEADESDDPVASDPVASDPIENDDILSGGWHHSAIHTQEAWDMIENPNEVVVAVCDSGYEAQHEDLIGRSVSGYSFVDDEDDTTPNTHHGTMVSGLIVGAYNDSYRTSGIAPFVKVMPIRITDKKGSSSMSTIIDCIKYGADHGAKVINVSFTGVQNESVQEAGKYAADRGALLVYSAGNGGRSRSSWPDHANVMIAGGIQQNIRRWVCDGWPRRYWCGSNYGTFVDVVAPAKSVLTTKAYKTFDTEPYGDPNGTSFSAPIVSAVAALVYSVNPYFTAEEVEDILKRSAQHLGYEYTYGEGVINARDAVALALDYNY